FTFRKDWLTENECSKSKNVKLKVFISYSRRHDQVVAGLLNHALAQKGFEVNFDRCLNAGADIATNIGKLIYESHAVVLILTQNSLDSAWVNQELGYAHALNKPILPIQTESGNIQPYGMFSGINHFDYYTNWLSCEISIDKLENNIYKAVDEKETTPLIIISKKKRTKQLIEQFSNLTDWLTENECSKNKKVKLYKRTSFSIFSVKGPLEEESSQYNFRYWDLLREQRRSIEKFIKLPNVETRLQLCPGGRGYDENLDKIKNYRKKNLLDFFEKLKNGEKNKNDENDENDENEPKKLSKRFKILFEKHNQPNVVAVEKHFVFEGLRPRPNNEYIYTLHWPYPSSKIKSYFGNFYDDRWLSFDKDYVKIVENIEICCSESCTGKECIIRDEKERAKVLENLKNEKTNESESSKKDKKEKQKATDKK
ncbi:Toll-Interleukin receptor domain protein, partial [Candidatus Magnetomorum sp. HK-1]